MLHKDVAGFRPVDGRVNMVKTGVYHADHLSFVPYFTLFSRRLSTFVDSYRSSCQPPTFYPSLTKVCYELSSNSASKRRAQKEERKAYVDLHSSHDHLGQSSQNGGKNATMESVLGE